MAFPSAAVHPDDFLLDQLDLHPRATVRALHKVVAPYKHEPTTVTGLLDRLGLTGLPGFADEVRRRL